MKGKRYRVTPRRKEKERLLKSDVRQEFLLTMAGHNLLRRERRSAHELQ
jgi:hypothetical protein